MTSRHVYLVAAAAPPVVRLAELLAELADHDWTTSVILTPTAATWIEAYHLAAVWDTEVRSEPDLPYSRRPLPDADAVLAAPLTFNSVNQWASGASNTFALGILNEMLGTGIPVVAAPCIKPSLRAHPAYQPSVERLTAAGVTFLDPDQLTFREPDGLTNLHWPQIVQSLLRAVAAHP